MKQPKLKIGDKVNQLIDFNKQLLISLKERK